MIEKRKGFSNRCLWPKSNVIIMVQNRYAQALTLIHTLLSICFSAQHQYVTLWSFAAIFICVNEWLNSIIITLELYMQFKVNEKGKDGLRVILSSLALCHLPQILALTGRTWNLFGK